MKSNTSDKCYVYFDIYVEPTLAELCNEKTFSNQPGKVKQQHMHGKLEEWIKIAQQQQKTITTQKSEVDQVVEQIV